MRARVRSPLGGRLSIPLLKRALLALAAGVVVPLACGSAQADVFGPISLVSDGALEGGFPQQAEYAHDSAISGDGRYVAFDGSVGGVTGVWRRDLATDVVEQVAGGDAEMPSISENGQYISFTTNEGASLAEITHDQAIGISRTGAVNVYVRDMANSPAQNMQEEGERSAGEQAFTVVSAASGSTEPLKYLAAGTKLGASAAGRSAISADGNEVAFVTTAVSNLIPYPKIEEEELKQGETPPPRAPSFQVAVRYISSDTTVLVSRCYFHCEEAADEGAAEPVVGVQQIGAVYPGKGLEFPLLPRSGEWAGASISADGSTVAWMGEDVDEQAPTLSAETLEPLYTEPLWRRIAPGSETHTERITGGSDPTNPTCVASGETALPANPSSSDPCQGPFAKETGGRSITGIWGEGTNIGDFIPRLSADGYTVAFISQDPPLSGGYGATRSGGGGEAQESDLYLVDMHLGLTRDQALTPLTEVGPIGLAYSAPIMDFEISPDGKQVAFTTARTQFPLVPPSFVSQPAAEPGLPELFDIDLAHGTLTRVTQGFVGGPSEQPHTVNPQEEDQYGSPPAGPAGLGALTPSFSDGGRKLAFTSTADNLVYGDGNTVSAPSVAAKNGSDAFLVEPTKYASIPTSQYISPAPITEPQPDWKLGISAISRSNGSVLLYVNVPASGSLDARVQSAIVTAVHVSRRARRSTRSSKHAARGRNGRTAAIVAERTVTTNSASAGSPAGELITLPLTLRKPYSQLASQRNGLSANVDVTFSSPGHPTLHGSFEVVFLRKPVAARASSKKTGHRRRKAHR